MLIRDILKRITKTKKTLRGERFFRRSLKGIKDNLAEMMGEIKCNVKKPMERSSKIASAFGVEYKPNQYGSLLLSRLNLKASNKHQ